MTIQEALRSVSSYPVPLRVLQQLAARTGLNLAADADGVTFDSSAYRTAEARLKAWLAKAPNTSEGGVSFSFSEKERALLMAESDAELKLLGTPKVSRFGYKGDRL